MINETVTIENKIIEKNYSHLNLIILYFTKKKKKKKEKKKKKKNNLNQL